MRQSIVILNTRDHYALLSYLVPQNNPTHIPIYNQVVPKQRTNTHTMTDNATTLPLERAHRQRWQVRHRMRHLQNQGSSPIRSRVLP